MGLRALLLVLVPFLLVNNIITQVSSQSEEYLFVKETFGKPPVASPKKSPLPFPPFYKPVPAPSLPSPSAPPKAVPPPPVKKPTPPPPTKVSPPTPVKKPTPPPPAKVTPPPPVYKPVPPSPPAKVSPPPPIYKPVPSPPPPPRPRTTKDCIPLCSVRCKLHSRKNVCLRACVTCCDRCKCVPPGQYGQREKCGKCYTNMTTRGGRPKCP